MSAAAIPAVEAQTLAVWLKAPNPPLLLDVRQPWEFEQAHIEGAKLIPLDELPARLAELPKDQQIVVYCRSGHRSSQAVSLLKENGFTKVDNLQGGINAWLAEQGKNTEAK